MADGCQVRGLTSLSVSTLCSIATMAAATWGAPALCELPVRLGPILIKKPETQTGEVTCPRSHPKLVMEADLNLGLSQACVLTCHMLTRDLPAVTYSKSTAPVLLEAA